MNVHRAAKDKRLKDHVLQYTRDYDQNHDIECQIIRVQTGNQRPDVLCDQRITNANPQSDDCAKKRDGALKPGNDADCYGDPHRDPKEDQTQCKSKSD